MRKALEYSIESLPVKNLNQISFEDENDETHVNQFILRSYYKNDMKPRYFSITAILEPRFYATIT